MLDIDIIEFVNLYSFPTGRRVVSLTEVAARGKRKGLLVIARRADEAVAHDRETLAMENRRRAANRSQYGERSLALDPQLDRSIGGLARFLTSQIDVYGVAIDPGKAAKKIHDKLFTKDVQTITQASFVEQHAMVDMLLTESRSEELEDAVAVLPQMPPMIAHITDLNREFGISLWEHDRSIPTVEQVRAAQAQGQRNLVEVVVLILAYYIEHAPHDREGRAEMLEPIIRQRDAIRETRRRRRAASDVDPDTGEVLDGGDDDQPDTDGDSPADSPADEPTDDPATDAP